LPPLEEIIPRFLILLLSLSVHEAAHAWTSNRLGDPTARELGRITLNPLAHIDWIGTVLFPLIAMASGVPLLGWAKPVPVNPRYFREPRRDFAIVAAAGPISNLILATAGAITLRILLSGETVFAGRVLGWVFIAAQLNVLLAVFNLIPIPPLDGGNVALGLLPPSLARPLAQMRQYGFLILYALMFTGVLGRFLFPVADSVGRVLGLPSLYL
jgi:Zn-dependent protease